MTRVILDRSGEYLFLHKDKGDSLCLSGINFKIPNDFDMNKLINNSFTFSCSEWQGVSFDGFNLNETKFYGADLTGATFDNADLRKAEFSYATLMFCNFINSKFDVKDLMSSSNLDGSLFISSDIKEKENIESLRKRNVVIIDGENGEKVYVERIKISVMGASSGNLTNKGIYFYYDIGRVLDINRELTKKHHPYWDIEFITE